VDRQLLAQVAAFECEKGKKADEQTVMNVYGWLKQTAGPHHWAQPAYKSVCVYCRRRERSAGYCGCSLALAKRGPQFQEFSAPDENKAVAIFRRSLPRSFILGGGSGEKEREKGCVKSSAVHLERPAARSTRRLFVCFVVLQTTDIITRLLNSCARARTRGGSAADSSPSLCARHTKG